MSIWLIHKDIFKGTDYANDIFTSIPANTKRNKKVIIM